TVRKCLMIKTVFSKRENIRRKAPQIPSSMHHVHILDTAVGSANIGDEIIYESCIKFIRHTFRNSYITSSSSHDGLGVQSQAFAHDADVIFLLGTNALSTKNILNRRF